MVISCTQGYFVSGEIQRDTHWVCNPGKTFVDDPLGFAVRILILSVKSSGEDSPEGADGSGVSSSPSGNL